MLRHLFTAWFFLVAMFVIGSVSYQVHVWFGGWFWPGVATVIVIATYAYSVEIAKESP